MGTRYIGDDAQGRPRWIRKPYNAIEFTVPAAYIPDLRSNNKGWSAIELLAEHDGPFVAFTRHGRIHRGGKDFELLHSLVGG